MRDHRRNLARRSHISTLPVRNGFRRAVDSGEPSCAESAGGCSTCLHFQELIELRRDLHDEIGAALVGIKLQLELAQLKLPEHSREAADALSHVMADVSTVVEQVRRLCSAHRLPAADTMDLGSALENMVSRLNGLLGHRLRVELRTSSDLAQLPAAVASAAFMIGQEALTNVVKHSGASWCRVSVEIRRDQLLVQVVDDGCGCVDPTSQPGRGLHNMRSRAREQGGDCLTGPAVPTGFAMVAWLPLHRIADETRGHA